MNVPLDGNHVKKNIILGAQRRIKPSLHPRIHSEQASVRSDDQVFTSILKRVETLFLSLNLSKLNPKPEHLKWENDTIARFTGSHPKIVVVAINPSPSPPASPRSFNQQSHPSPTFTLAPIQATVVPRSGHARDAQMDGVQVLLVSAHGPGSYPLGVCSIPVSD